MTSASYGNLNTPDPRYSINGPMNPSLWKSRYYGDSGERAEEIAVQLGGRAVVVQHGRYSWAVYQPMFDAITTELSDHDRITLEPVCEDGEWLIRLEVAGEGHGDDPALYLSRGDLATLIGSMLPEAAQLLDRLRSGARGAPRVKGANSRTARYSEDAS